MIRFIQSGRRFIRALNLGPHCFLDDGTDTATLEAQAQFAHEHSAVEKNMLNQLLRAVHVDSNGLKSAVESTASLWSIDFSTLPSLLVLSVKSAKESLVSIPISFYDEIY